jgi:fructosamine-3-kinase
VSLPAGASGAVRVHGGDINEAWRVRLADGRLAFVKTRADAGEGEYEREAAALRWLAEPRALQVPEVLDVGADHLALQWVEHGSLSEEGAEELGRGLAGLHASGAPCFGDPGLGGRGPGGAGGVGDPGSDGAGGPGSGGSGAGRPGSRGVGGPAVIGPPAVIGSLRLPNDPADDWPSFYAQRRLAPALAAARRRGAISSAGVGAVESVCESIAELCGPPEPPARLHGDLWTGNVLAGADGRPWLVDPTAYGGHREVDLAMLRLFGAPSPRVFAAYEEASPLAEGWQRRVPLWQLLPLLVHAALFGGSYGAAAERAALHSLS